MARVKQRPTTLKTRGEGYQLRGVSDLFVSMFSLIKEVTEMQSVQHLLEPVQGQEHLIRTVVREEVELALREHGNIMKCLCQKVPETQTVQHLLESVQEPLIRGVVREELKLALREHLNSMKWTSGKEVHSPESRSLQLQFLNNICLPVFTDARIEGEESSPIKVALIDALTGKIINSGPESSAKVEIVPLQGDFNDEERDNWTLEEFKSNIVRERKGKRPLLTGDTLRTLKEGIGLVGEITFTDNSSWTRSGKFKLGARVMDNFDGIRVREAKTESFTVREHRGELYKKHYPPSLSDEVWRLEMISKDGAFHKRLRQENIKTVKDFLTKLVIDPSKLRHILGTSMSTKKWEVTERHAWTCILDKTIHLYCPHSSQWKSGVTFNVVGQVMGLLSECQYLPLDKLSETEKDDAQNLVISAFEHWEEVVPFDNEAYLMSSSSHSANVLHTSSSPRMENSNGSKFLASHKMVGFDYTQPSVSSPDIISSIDCVGSMSDLDDNVLHSGYDQTAFPPQVTNSLICDTETHAFSDEDMLQYFDFDIQSPNIGLISEADLQSAVDSFLLAPSIDKLQRRCMKLNPQRRWMKLFSVLKFFFVRKTVALKRTCVREIQSY